ncbi:MAG TPA: PLxRFG domain-containing protein, partial [bacterium]|nr:PLxRFG domain-containing protein [bacterium]
PGEAKAEHERSWSESIREGMDTLRDWIKEMRGRKDWKTMRPETTWLERIFATPAYYFGKVPALQRVMKAALEMFDNVEHFKNVLFNADGGKGESHINRISQFRKAFKKEYQRWAGYIVDRDRNAVGYTVRRDGDRFQVHNPAGEAVKSYAKWEDAWAFAFQQEAADMAKLDKPFSEAAQQALIAYRTMAFNEYMMLSEPLRRIVEKAQAEGRPVPTVAYPVYGTDKDGKTRKRMMEVDLRVALDMMGERIGYYMPRLRRQGRYQLIAEKDGIRELQYFKTRAGLEREAAKLRKEGYKIQKGRARQLPGEVYGELGPTMAMENVINQALRDMRRGGDKTRLEDFGLKGEWRKTTDGKDEFVVTGQFDSRYVEAFKTLKGHGFYEGAWHFVEPGENFEGTIVKRLGEFTTTFNLELAFAQELVQQVADVLRSHGSLAHRIKRSSATGEEVWRGYSEEPFEAIVTAGRNIAAGHAKGIMARKMHDAIMGRDISWQQFVEQAGPDSTYEDYLEMVNERRIDPATQPNAYKDGVDYMKDMLRPSESLDRTIGMIKGAAMFKYIAGRVSAPVINLTALPTVVVASLRGHAHIPFAKAVRLLTKAIRDYTTYSFHPEKLDAETRELFQEIRDRGWDMAQYNEEALEALRSKTAQRYDKFIDTLMLGFSASERLNRAATIAAAYRGIKDQHEGEWTPEAQEAALEQAKFASDRAHSIYGKANYPMLMRGGGAFGETAKSFYMFKNFAHNFLQNFIELGFKKREAAAAAWLIMSPIAVGGATAALPVSLLLAALRQVMDDDPEEALMEFLQENVGDSAEMAARFGVFGLAGVNLKGSLQVGITDIPTKVTDLLGAPYEVWVDLTGGIGDMIRGDITKGAEKVSPLFLGNMLKALREYNEGLTTKSNAPIFFGNEQARADTTDAVLRFLSFNPSRLARIHEKQFNERLTEAEFTESRQDIYAKFKKYFLMPEEKRTKAAYIDLLSEVSEYNNRVQGVGRADIPRITGESIRNALRQAVRAPRKERIRAGGTLYGATAVGRPSFAPQAPKAPRAPQAPARPLAAAMPQRRLRDFMETA